jgi:hypothetical protein
VIYLGLGLTDLEEEGELKEVVGWIGREEGTMKRGFGFIYFNNAEA